MGKLSEEKLDKVSGGAKIFKDIEGSSFKYIKTTCDECGKLLNEEVCSKDASEFYNSAYKYHEDEYGICDGKDEVSLCRECYVKRLLKK